MDSNRIKIGVSACLLGMPTRFDGGHKRDAFLTEKLAPFVEWVSVCPEEEAGLGTPRETMRLMQGHDGLRVLTVRTRRDVTAQLRRYSEAKAPQLAKLALDGFILKKDSPSCGLMRVKVYTEAGPGLRSGRGLFAQALCTADPLLPVEEEGRLCDLDIRSNFLERVFARRRLRRLCDAGARAGDLVSFHTAHKLTLLAHSPIAYAQLGRLVAGGRRQRLQDLTQEYAGAFMTALSTIATRGRHVNVLQHAVGYFRWLVSADARRDLAQTIADYEHGVVPLIVPIRLFAHYIDVHRIEYLAQQTYFNRDPRELLLPNLA